MLLACRKSRLPRISLEAEPAIERDQFSDQGICAKSVVMIAAPAGDECSSNGCSALISGDESHYLIGGSGCVERSMINMKDDEEP